MTNTRNIQFSPPDITEAEISMVAETLRSGWITTGPRTKELEGKLANFCDTSRVVCLNSATSCLESILRLLGIGAGDEVITTAYTYTSSASVVCHVGATLKLVDVAEGTREMDYDKLADAITEKTKAIIPVDLGGIICDYDRIFEVVESKCHLFLPSNKIQESFGRVIVVADGAHALGAKRKGLMCGKIADFTAFSFHAVKNLTTAEGGALTWRPVKGFDDEELYKHFMLLSLHGQSKDAFAKVQKGSWEYDIVAPYYKCNMTDIMASIGLAQFERFPSLLKRRRNIIGRYNDAFSSLNVQLMDHYGKDHQSSGHLYIVRLLGKDSDYRNEVIVKMAERGIATNVHYKPLPMHTAYKNLGFSIEDFPNSFDMYKNAITLPLHTLLSDEDVEYIIDNFKDVITNS